MNRQHPTPLLRIRWLIVAAASFSFHQPIITCAADQETATQSVIAEGVGTTEDEALKDAFRAAVRQVVGAVVDAETLVKNDDVVKDQVLTYSDGFISKQTILSTKKDGGLVRTTIQATVERRKVIQKLQAANVTVKTIEGQSLFAEAVTQQEAKGNATALLRKALADLPTMLTAEMVGKPEYDAHKGAAVLQISVKPDRRAFDAFRERLEQLLEKIALRTDSALISAKEARRIRGGTPHFEGDFMGDTTPLKLVGPSLKPKGECCIWVNTFINGSSTTTKWNGYVLDVAPLGCILDLIGETNVIVSLLDSTGGTITEDTFKLADVSLRSHFAPNFVPVSQARPVAALVSLVVRDPDNGHGHSCDGDLTYFKGWISNNRYLLNLCVAPFFFELQGQGRYERVFAYTQEKVMPRAVKLTLDELKRVTEVRCKVTFRPDAEK
jgi:hypothetical protein